MNYAAACQLCKTSQPPKAYVRCTDCEIFLCSHCDFIEHYHLREKTGQQQNQRQHKRVRICDECEEQECATQCHICEQVLCLPCSNRLHQKGARQKHKLYTISAAPDFIRTEKLKSGSSSVDNLKNPDTRKKEFDVLENNERTSGRGNSQHSGKNSMENNDEYFTEEEHPYQHGNVHQQDYKVSTNNYNHSYYKGSGLEKNLPASSQHLQSRNWQHDQQQQRQDRGGYYSSSNNNMNYTDKQQSQGFNRQNYYQQQQQPRDGGRQGTGSSNEEYNHKNTHYARGTKGSGCYSSGGSSAGSHHNSNSNYIRGQNEGSNYYQGQSYNNFYSSSGKSSNKPQNYKKYQGGLNSSSNHNSHYNQSQSQYSSTSHHYGRQNSNSRRGGNPNINSRDQTNSNVANQQLQQQQLDIIPTQFYEGDQIVIPIWQPLVKCDQNQQEMYIIQKELFNFANQGELLIESNLFLGVLADKLQIQENECQRLIDSAIAQKIIHQTTRNFMKMKTLIFLSPKLDIISHECICWAMSSLKRDEMTPTEKTLQNRIKEAFAFKISASLWEFIIQSLETTDRKLSSTIKNKLQIVIKPSKSKSAYLRDNQYGEANSEDQKVESYLDLFVYPFKQGQSLPEFKVKEIEEDPSIGQMTKAIFMKNEDEWVGVDQNIEDVNYILYDQLKSFLQEYFCNQDNEDDNDSKIIQSSDLTQGKTGIKFNHTQTTTDQDFEEVRAIAGGRYGCAQFVKLCGPLILRKCSLGRLAQLVQYAVKEDVLRYHKTLLVWTTSVDKHKRLAEEMQKKSTQNASIAAKLDVVKASLIEILAESKSGMSLAQLPLYLRRKLPFQLDLNELGFPKLKDLILSMSDKIKLELKGHNHPFAYLIKGGRFVHSSSNSDDFQSIPKSKTFIKQGHPNLSEDVNINRHLKNTLNIDEEDIQNVLRSFYNLMREVPMGVDSDKLPIILGKKLNKEFNFKNYGCNSLIEFLKKYVMPTMDIEIIYSDSGHNDVYLIRSREFFMTYTYQQIQAQQQQQQQQQIEKDKNINLVNQQFQAMNFTPAQMISPTNNMQAAIVHQQMQRQDSGGGSLNISSQCYVPNHQSLYGGSTSANTSTQINVSHIRFNTADTLEMQSQSFQRQEINNSINPNTNPFSKPPKHPQLNIGTANQLKAQPINQAQTQQKSNSYKTFPPVMQQQQNQQVQSQNMIRHQQTSSNATNFSLQSYVPQQLNQPQGFRGFFLSPSHLQMNKMQLNEQHSQNPSNITSPLHSRAISFNNSAFGGQAAMQSTNSKSASHDFSIQSQIMPNQLNLKSNHIMFPQSQSGYTSPNTQTNIFSGINFQSKLFNQVPNQIESTFGSPIPGSYRFDSINQGHYEESPPYNQDEDDDQAAKRDFRYLEKLCDDDMDFKSGDEQSQMSIQSPQLSAVGNSGLRIPVSTFNGYGPGINISNPRQYGAQAQKKQWGSVDLMRQGSQGTYHRSSMQSSNSCKNILGGPIAEGGSSSSDENKRPSTVHEQKTEEDAEDNNGTTNLLNQKWNQMNQQNSQNQAETENLLFQLSNDIQHQQQFQYAQQLQQQQQMLAQSQQQQQQQQQQFNGDSNLPSQYFEGNLPQNTQFF